MSAQSSQVTSIYTISKKIQRIREVTESVQALNQDPQGPASTTVRVVSAFTTGAYEVSRDAGGRGRAEDRRHDL